MHSVNFYLFINLCRELPMHIKKDDEKLRQEELNDNKSKNSDSDDRRSAINTLFPSISEVDIDSLLDLNDDCQTVSTQNHTIDEEELFHEIDELLA